LVLEKAPVLVLQGLESARDDFLYKTKELSSFEGMKKKREKIMVATEPP
jgi:hypothetical protein